MKTLKEAKLEVASANNVSHHDMYALARDKDEDVRYAVAMNVNAPDSVLYMLSTEPGVAQDYFIQKYATQTLKKQEEAKKASLEEARLEEVRSAEEMTEPANRNPASIPDETTNLKVLNKLANLKFNKR
jgi:hypothetical protein